MGQITELNYGAAEASVERAIVTEDIHSLDLTGTQLEVDVPNINLVSNDEYIMLRRNGFGGSDSSILLGVNPFKTLPELIKEKLSTTISAEERAIGELTAVRKGRDLEPLIIQKFEQYFQQDTFKPSDMYKFRDYPYLKVNYDGVTGKPGAYVPAEIKVVTVKGERHYNPAKTIFDEINGFKPLPENPTGHNWSIETKAGSFHIKNV